MGSIKGIRRTLGVSQDLIAAYLSVTRSLFAMAERRERELPTPALLKIGYLDIALAAGISPDTAAKELQKQTAQSEKTLLALAEKYERLATIASRKLASLRNKYEECLKTVQATTNLLAELPKGPATKDDREWLELVESMARIKIESCGIGAQMVLQLEVDAFSDLARKAKEISYNQEHTYQDALNTK